MKIIPENTTKMLVILEGVKKSITLKNRVIENNKLVYVTSGGEKCPIGKYLSNEDIETLKKKNMLSTELFLIWEVITTDKIKSLPMLFWYNIEKFYVEELNWTNFGLSNRGLVVYEGIKREIEENTYEKGISYAK